MIVFPAFTLQWHKMSNRFLLGNILLKTAVLYKVIILTEIKLIFEKMWCSNYYYYYYYY